ncbi:DUF424 domain-containing protein [[Eubacterium] cellulosolvens]
MEKVFVKKYCCGKDILVAVCDKDLIGKTLRDGKIKLEVKKEFYGDRLTTPEEAAKALSEANTGNIVGKKSVKIAIEKNLVNPSAVIHIAGIPHVNIIRL